MTSAYPCKVATVTPFHTGAANEIVSKHHLLQMRAWRCLENFAERIVSGDLRPADETTLLSALDAHVTSALFPSPEAASARHWWHPLVVKADAHSLKPGVAHKAESGVRASEIVVIDLGVVVDGLEVDCGLSVGFTPRASALALASQELTHAVIDFILLKHHLGGHCSPADAHAELLRLAAARGLTHVAPNAGHRVGPFPTRKSESKIRAGDPALRFEPGAWMVEVHVADAAGDIAAFYEDCVYVHPPA